MFQQTMLALERELEEMIEQGNAAKDQMEVETIRQLDKLKLLD